ncbi:MAG: hypothetical protein ABIQ57_04755, partial [Candidatus Kapaibacterium sp.]
MCTSKELEESNQKCVNPLIKIDWVYRDGEELKVLRRQYVNIDQEMKHPEIQNYKMAMGPCPSVRVRFEKKLKAKYTISIRLIEEKKNAEYSLKELSIKEKKFRHWPDNWKEVQVETDENGEAILEKIVWLSAAGNNRYCIEAKGCSESEPIETTWLQTFRLVFLQQIRMEGIGLKLDNDRIDQEFANCGIIIKRLDAVLVEDQDLLEISSKSLEKFESAFKESPGWDLRPYT